MTTHQYSIGQRGLRAALLVGALAISSIVSSEVFLNLGFAVAPPSLGNLVFDAIVVLPFNLGAAVVIVIQSFRHDRYTRGAAVGTALLAVLGGVVLSLLFGLLQPIEVIVAVFVAVITPVPVVLGALFAHWLESRACRTWGNAQPV